MKKIAKLSAADRRILFRNTAQKVGMHEAIIEKDFWVCLMLDYLFHDCPWKDTFTFKGGTSLSKCYDLIQRFSEDIDLILDWRVIRYSKEEPWLHRSNTKQDTFNKEANVRAEVFLRETLLPQMIQDVTELIGEPANLYIDEMDAQTICFQYPKMFQTESVLQIIRLEIGALAAWTPSNRKLIHPYVAEIYPSVFEQAYTSVLTAAVERTFWEKLIILHHEANRPENLEMPKRYSRHYYDLYCIAHSDNKDAAYHNLDLLKHVVEFKMKFYPRKWAKYEEAMTGALLLVPPDYRLQTLEEDYNNMSEMIFGEYPPFDELIKFMGQLQSEINAL